MPVRRLAAVLVPAACLALAPAAEAKLTLRIAKFTETVKIPQTASVGNLFDDTQRFSTMCRPNERAISPGIVDSPRHIVGQSFGPSAVGGFAVGAQGSVKLRLQILCARGATFPNKRPEGKTVPAADGRTLTTTAKANCGRGRVALGAPLSQEFAPGFGRFTSRPASASSWEVRVEGVPTNFPFQQTVPAYADVACVPARALKSVKIEKQTTTALVSATSAKLTVKCSGGRRAVGWGVDQQPFTRSSSGWVIPFVRKAALSSTSVAFTFELPAGAQPAGSSGLSAEQTAYVVCAKPA